MSSARTDRRGVRRPAIPDSRFPIPDSGSDDGFDSAADVEITDDLHPSRLGGGGEVIENAVHRALVEDAVVPKAPEVQLQTLELEADVAGHVRDDDRAEVRRPALEQRELAGIAFHTAERTEGRELGARHVDLVVPAGIRIWKRLEKFWLWHGRRMHEPRANRQTSAAGLE